MVPAATFTSYYGRPAVKPPRWKADIPPYLFSGGLAGGSSLLAAGADLTGRPGLRRVGRLGAMAALTFSMGALVHDLGRTERFLNMLRTAKLTSPMSVGTWILSAYSPFVALAAAAELAEMLPCSKRSRVLRSTAVPLADTATPSWHRRTASCHSSSSAPRQPLPVASGCWPRPSGSRDRQGGWQSQVLCSS